VTTLEAGRLYVKAPAETDAAACCMRLFVASVSHGVTVAGFIPPESTKRWLVMDVLLLIATMAKSPVAAFLYAETYTPDTGARVVSIRI